MAPHKIGDLPIFVCFKIRLIAVANIVEEIKAPIAQEMRIFEQKFYESMQSNVPLLDKVTRFIVTTKGKQMRPMFVFLCAKLVGSVNEKTFRGASMIELIHTATLVHDDVVDESFKRRNFFSINALWKNKIAVLVGDYLLCDLSGGVQPGQRPSVVPEYPRVQIRLHPAEGLPGHQVDFHRDQRTPGSGVGAGPGPVGGQ